MYAHLVTYTAFIPYTAFLLTQVFRICGVAFKPNESQTFRLKLGPFNRIFNLKPNPMFNRTMVNEQPKGWVKPTLNLLVITSLSCCSSFWYTDPKPRNFLIKEITRAPPGKITSALLIFSL